MAVRPWLTTGKDDAGDATHWITRSRSSIAISEMTNVHLLNAVAYLDRKHRESLNEQAEAFAAAWSFDGESMARYYTDQAAGEVRIVPPADSHPAYGGLIKEIESRGLGRMLEVILRDNARRGA